MALITYVQERLHIGNPVTLQTVKQEAERILSRYMKKRWVVGEEAKEMTRYGASLAHGVVRKMTTREGYQTRGFLFFSMTSKTDVLAPLASPKLKKESVNHKPTSQARRDLGTNLQVRVRRATDFKAIIYDCQSVLQIDTKLRKSKASDSLNYCVHSILLLAVKGYVYENIMRYIKSRWNSHPNETAFELDCVSSILRSHPMSAARLEVALECRYDVHRAISLDKIIERLVTALEDNVGCGSARGESDLTKKINKMLKYIRCVNDVVKPSLNRNITQAMTLTGIWLYRATETAIAKAEEKGDAYLAELGW